jgi:hypothetical protein
VLLWATAPPPHRVQLPAAGRQTADGASDAPVPEGHDGGGAARAGPFPAVSPAADDAFVRPSLGAVEATPGLARAGPLSGAAFAGVTAADDAARFRTVAAGPTRFGRSARDGAPLAPAIGGGATPARLAYHIQRRAVLPPDHVLPPMAVTADYGLLHALLGPAPASGAARQEIKKQKF